MLRIVLTLILLSSTIFAQTQEKKDAYKFFEYEKISDSSLKEKVNSLCEKLANTAWTGWIINYGTPKKIVNREKKIRKNLCRQSFSPPRIIIVRGGKNGKSRTEFWLAPPNVEPPISKPQK